MTRGSLAVVLSLVLVGCGRGAPTGAETPKLPPPPPEGKQVPTHNCALQTSPAPPSLRAGTARVRISSTSGELPEGEAPRAKAVCGVSGGFVIEMCVPDGGRLIVTGTGAAPKGAVPIAGENAPTVELHPSGGNTYLFLAPRAAKDFLELGEGALTARGRFTLERGMDPARAKGSVTVDFEASCR